MTDQSVRKKQIMEVAKELFAKKGYYAVTMEEVAKACNVAKGTIYLYFDSKATLFIEIFEEAHRKIIETVQSIIKSGKAFFDMIFEVFDYFEKFIRRDEFFIRFGKVQKGFKGSHIPTECFQKINESVIKLIKSFEKEAVKAIQKYMPNSKLNLNDLYEIIVAMILAIEHSDSKTLKNTAISVLLNGVKEEVKC
ncbi:MAG: TetR/AcrR family transcriptional regulator [candidate division WOR-3 bacterium]